MAKLSNNYFPHDFNAKRDRKILRLRKALGAEGYGIYWMLVETLCTEEDFSYPIKDLDLLAEDYGCSVEKISAVVTSFGLFSIDKDERFYSLSLIARMQKYLEVSEKARSSVNARWEKARKLKEIAINDTTVLQPYNDSITNVLPAHYDGNTMKGKESIEKDIKEKEINFEVFWELYGIKKETEKAGCIKAWKILSKFHTDIIAHAKRYVAHYSGDKEQFRANPLKYLQGGVWQDCIRGEVINKPAVYEYNPDEDFRLPIPLTDPNDFYSPLVDGELNGT